MPARAPDLDAARIVGADLAVGALVRGRRVGRRVRPKRRERGRVLGRAAQRVQDDGEEGVQYGDDAGVVEIANGKPIDDPPAAALVLQLD